MSTTYILAGGNDRGSPKYGPRISDFVTRQIGSPSILSCFFAHDEKHGEENWSSWQAWYSEYFPNSQVSRGSVDMFREQVQKVDVVYLHGGPKNMIVNELPDFSNFEAAVSGKIVIGSSAGANYLSKGYYRNKLQTTVPGSAIISTPVLVHYGIEGWEGHKYDPGHWDRALNQMQESFGVDDVLCLGEGEFAVFRK